MAAVVDISCDEEYVVQLGKRSGTNNMKEKDEPETIDKRARNRIRAKTNDHGNKRIRTNNVNDDDDDCVVLDGDPVKHAQVENGLVDIVDESEELFVVGEKGKVACRDYPHPRHLCAKFRFTSTPHEMYCKQCHCYVCGSLAPCQYWGTGHCDATDKLKPKRNCSSNNPQQSVNQNQANDYRRSTRYILNRLGSGKQDRSTAESQSVRGRLPMGKSTQGSQSAENARQLIQWKRERDKQARKQKLDLLRMEKEEIENEIAVLKAEEASITRTETLQDTNRSLTCQKTRTPTGVKQKTPNDLFRRIVGPPKKQKTQLGISNLSVQRK